MATLRQFAEQTAREVKRYFPKEYQDIVCEVEEILKNNDVHRMGIIFRKPEERVSVTVYMESYYANYNSGKPMDDIMKDIVSEVVEAKELGKRFPVDGLGEYEQMKGLVQPVLINAKANRERVQHSPHIIMEDLAVVFRVANPVSFGKMSTPIRDERLEEWGIGKEQLYEQAFKNMRESEEYALYNLEDVIGGLQEGKPPGGNILKAPDDHMKKRFDQLDFRSEDTMTCVLTSKIGLWGAAAVACPDVMEKVCRLFPEGFYILPSSIHECLIVWKSEGMEVKELEKMVREINRAQVGPEERLSDHVYEYDRERGSIRLAAKELDKERGMER